MHWSEAAANILNTPVLATALGMYGTRRDTATTSYVLTGDNNSVSGNGNTVKAERDASLSQTNQATVSTSVITETDTDTAYQYKTEDSDMNSGAYSNPLFDSADEAAAEVK